MYHRWVSNIKLQGYMRGQRTLLLFFLTGLLQLFPVLLTAANSTVNGEPIRSAYPAKELYQLKRDSLNSAGKIYGGSGIQLIGYTPDIDAFFTYYQFYGSYWYLNDKVSFNVCFEPFKINWTRLDSAKHSPGFDKARYFSLTFAINSGIRLDLSQDKYKYRAIEIGAGANLPLYYDLKKKRKGEKVVIAYPNRYQDLFVYTRLHYDIFNLKAEYHPFDLIKDPKLPEPARILIGLELTIASD